MRWVNKDFNVGDVLKRSDLEVLRPCPENAFGPDKINSLAGRSLRKSVKKGQHLTEMDLGLYRQTLIVIPALNEEATIAQVINPALKYADVLVMMMDRA